MAIVPFFALLLSSCGIIDRIAVDSTANIFYEASKEIETDDNWQNIKNGLMANLKIVEGILYVDPDNEKMLATAVKGYAGYAYAIDETLYLGDFLADNGRKRHLNQAIFNYSKALKYGLRFLKGRGITYKDLILSQKRGEGLSLLDSHLDDTPLDLETVLFTAQSLATLINLQKDKIALVAQLSVAKNLFDWVCKKNPGIVFGTCHIFYGIYYSSRPVMMGGNPKRAKREFTKMIKKYPLNWLGRISYMRYYLIPREDRQGYNKQKKIMGRLFRKFNRLRRWSPTENKKVLGDDRLRIYQTIALKRYGIIRRNEKVLF